MKSGKVITIVLKTISILLQKFNQVVLWDKIILRDDKSKLTYHTMNTKYYFFDNGNGLK
jgi:hypothetical protein